MKENLSRRAFLRGISAVGISAALEDVALAKLQDKSLDSKSFGRILKRPNQEEILLLQIEKVISNLEKNFSRSIDLLNKFNTILKDLETNKKLNIKNQEDIFKKNVEMARNLKQIERDMFEISRSFNNLFDNIILNENSIIIVDKFNDSKQEIKLPEKVFQNISNLKNNLEIINQTYKYIRETVNKEKRILKINFSDYFLEQDESIVI